MVTEILIGVVVVVVIAAVIMNRNSSEKNEEMNVNSVSKKPQKQKKNKRNSKNNIKRKKTELVDYSVYTMSSAEKSRHAMIGMAVMFAVAFVFYRSIVFSSIVCLLGLIYPKLIIASLIKKRQDQLMLEFKDALYSIYTSLSAGISPENAIINVVPDMEDLYNDRENFIVEEFTIMKRRIDLNLDLDDVLLDFADRSGLEDVQNFVDVFLTSLVTGRRQGDIIKNAINNIVDKIEIKREISIMVSEKKFEARIMSVMPIFLILFLSMSAPDYFDTMYTTFTGRVAMTIVIIGLGASAWLADRIMRIEV